MRSKQFRLHQQRRAFVRARKYLLVAWTKSEPDPKRARKYVKVVSRTPAVCSCWMCGNPRKHREGRARLTRQELRHDVHLSINRVVDLELGA